MARKTICFGAVSTERYIAERGQCGVVQQRLFKTEASAIEFYGSEGEHEIVRITIESIEQPALETRVR